MINKCNYTDLDLKNYNYLQQHGITTNTIEDLFGKQKTTWMLQSKSTIGFYVEFLKVQETFYPGLNTREMGTIIRSIDPWMAASVTAGNPQNAYLKVWKVKKQ